MFFWRSNFQLFRDLDFKLECFYKAWNTEVLKENTDFFSPQGQKLIGGILRDLVLTIETQVSLPEEKGDYKETLAVSGQGKLGVQ